MVLSLVNFRIFSSQPEVGTSVCRTVGCISCLDTCCLLNYRGQTTCQSTRKDRGVNSVNDLKQSRQSVFKLTFSQCASDLHQVSTCTVRIREQTFYKGKTWRHCDGPRSLMYLKTSSYHHQFSTLKSGNTFRQLNDVNVPYGYGWADWCLRSLSCGWDGSDVLCTYSSFKSWGGDTDNALNG